MPRRGCVYLPVTAVGSACDPTSDVPHRAREGLFGEAEAVGVRFGPFVGWRCERRAERRPALDVGFTLVRGSYHGASSCHGLIRFNCLRCCRTRRVASRSVRLTAVRRPGRVGVRSHVRSRDVSRDYLTSSEQGWCMHDARDQEAPKPNGQLPDRLACPCCVSQRSTAEWR